MKNFPHIFCILVMLLTAVVLFANGCNTSKADPDSILTGEEAEALRELAIVSIESGRRVEGSEIWPDSIPPYSTAVCAPQFEMPGAVIVGAVCDFRGWDYGFDR